MVSSLSQTYDLQYGGSLRVVRGGAWELRTSVMSSKGPLRAMRLDPPLWLLGLVGKLNGLQSNATHTMVVWMQILVSRDELPVCRCCTGQSPLVVAGLMWRVCESPAKISQRNSRVCTLARVKCKKTKARKQEKTSQETQKGFAVGAGLGFWRN